jgi:hypothetical protein
MEHVPNGSGKLRAIWTEAQVLALLEEFECSGYTVKKFSAVSDLNETTFYP